jgi:hypothetical protein
MVGNLDVNIETPYQMKMSFLLTFYLLFKLFHKIKTE